MGRINEKRIIRGVNNPGVSSTTSFSSPALY